MAILGLHHAGLVVPSLDQALEFYSGVLGFEAVQERSIAAAACPEDAAHSARARGHILRGGWGYLEILEFEHPVHPDHQFFWTPVNTYGIRHISLMVDDALETYAYLKEHMIFHGVPVRHSVESSENDSWSAYARDPFGNIIELWRLGEEDPQPYVPQGPLKVPDMPEGVVKSGILGLHHAAIVVPDLQQATAFYRDVLGFRIVQLGPIEPSPYAEVHTQLEQPEALSHVFDTGWGYLEVWEYRNPVHPHPQVEHPYNKLGFSHLTFMVDDCRAEQARLQDQVSFAGSHTGPSPGTDGAPSRSVCTRDPFGNTLEFWQIGAKDPGPFAPEVLPYG